MKKDHFYCVILNRDALELPGGLGANRGEDVVEMVGPGSVGSGVGFFVGQQLSG